MLKRSSTSRISMAMLLSLATASLHARSGDDRCYDYDYANSPLDCGAWSVQLQVGVYPIDWVHRGDVLINNPNVGQTNGITSVGALPKFGKFYKTPWIIGGEVGYVLCDNVNSFIELNYAHAHHKDSTTNTTAGSASSGGTTATPISSLALQLENYRIFSAYVGASYYTHRWCNILSIFGGAKIGLLHHNQVNFLSLSTQANGSAGNTNLNSYAGQTNGTTFFNSNTVVSGGIHAGLDFWVCSNWSVVLKGEVVASSGPSSLPNIVLQSPDTVNLRISGNNATNLIIGQVRTEISFPVTLGVKYTF